MRGFLLVFCFGLGHVAAADNMTMPSAPAKSALEKALDTKHKGPNPPAASTPMPQGGMMGEDMMAHMGKMGQMMMGMAKTAPGNSGTASAPSTLPGFPGQSHLYHVGATGFFLDHASMLDLSADQKAALEKIRYRNTSEEKASANEVQRLEEELWRLTGSDRPDLSSIEAKVGEIESSKKQRRLSFIRSVGEAASLLTSAQRDTVLGRKTGATPDKAKAPPASDPGKASSGMSGMGDM